MASIEEALDYLPETLRVWIDEIVVGNDVGLKRTSIGQAIMQAAHPGVLIALLQLGIGVQLHHHFASKFVINSFNKHGFRCSYQEVTRLERNAAKVHGTDLPCQK